MTRPVPSPAPELLSAAHELRIGFEDPPSRGELLEFVRGADAIVGVPERPHRRRAPGCGRAAAARGLELRGRVRQRRPRRLCRARRPGREHAGRPDGRGRRADVGADPRGGAAGSSPATVSCVSAPRSDGLRTRSSASSSAAPCSGSWAPAASAPRSPGSAATGSGWRSSTRAVGEARLRAARRARRAPPQRATSSRSTSLSRPRRTT